MKSDKKQTLAMIGIAFIVIGGIFIAISLAQPRIYNSEITAHNSYINSTTAFMPSNNVNTTAYQTVANNSQSSVETTVADANSNISYPLNINTATVEELKTIDGVGDALAQKIVGYRESMGGYYSVDQIKNISGIGDATFEKIAPYLTV